MIRAGQIGDLSLIARRIADMHRITCAAPSYLRAHGQPVHPAALETDHLIVGYLNARTAGAHPLSFTRDGQTLEVAGRYQAAVNEASTYLTAGLAGCGIIQPPYFMAREHLESGALRVVLPEWLVSPLPLHVVYPPNRHLSTRLRIFVDWVAALFGAGTLAPPRAPPAAKDEPQRLPL